MKTINMTQFTPADAERIAGVGVALQRDWRRRGLLHKQDGHARFDLFDLATLTVMKLLSDRGIGPSETADVAYWAASGIAADILRDYDAYEGDHDRTCEARGLPPRQLKPLPDNLADMLKAAGVDPDDLPKHPGFDGDWLMSQTFNYAGRPHVIPAKILVWFANGEHTFHNSFDAIRSNSITSDERFAGAVVILDLEAIATRIHSLAARAFVHVEFPDEPTTAMQYGAVIPLAHPIVATTDDNLRAESATLSAKKEGN